MYVIKMAKKGIDAPSNIMILVIFVVLIAVILLMVFFFGQNIKDSSAFQNVTNFSRNIGWG